MRRVGRSGMVDLGEFDQREFYKRTQLPQKLRSRLVSVGALGLVALACSSPDVESGAGSGGTNTLAIGGAATGVGVGGTQVGGTAGPGQSASTVVGGRSATGGSTNVVPGNGGRGGSPTTGGSLAAGGSPATGGSLAAGGSPTTGGSLAAGGSPATGGSLAAGGSRPTGGTTGRGATTGAGGRTGSGGTTGNGGQTGVGGALTITFHNGVFWNDTNGKRIEAHGGGFLKEGDTWYWFGEDKSGNSGTFKGVNCYASKDLVTWVFRNAVLTRSTATQLNTSDRIIERPKVIYNETTKKYVMWAHWDNGNYSEASASVFTSPTVDGNYTFVKSFKPFGNMSRDCNLFKEDNGTAYFMSAANNNADMMVYQLTDDYLDTKQLIIKLWAGASREAPAMFKAGGTYFMINSGATGWNPNQAQYASAPAISGPWSSLANIGDSTTFDSQSTYVIPIVGTDTTTYIYAGDRWQDPDLASSKYIWLPLVVNGTKLTMSNQTQWSLNLTTGRTN